MDTSKYSIGYYPAPGTHNKWVLKDHVEKAPQWCSVDLRDGNQSLVIPMSLEEKLEFYRLLLKVGFKEIEVGFPAASETEYEFLRTLIENDMIPQDVTVQVLTQCREHIIRKTFDACKGAPNAIIHFYNSTSVAQREQVFRKSKEEIKQIAIEGAKLVKKLAAEYEGNFRFEYSPESFTGTEPEYALEVCNAVLDVLEPGPDNNVIINLPVTVEMSMPHVYASQVDDDIVVGAGLQHIQNCIAHFQSVFGLGAGEAFGRILEAEVAFVFRCQLLDQLCAVNGDLLDLFLGLPEDLLTLGNGSGIVEVDDGIGCALAGVESLADDVLTALGQHLNGYIIGNHVVVDQSTQELELCFGCGGEANFNFLKANL